MWPMSKHTRLYLQSHLTRIQGSQEGVLRENSGGLGSLSFVLIEQGIFLNFKLTARTCSGSAAPG